MKDRTVLSVAHRLEAIKDADVILCMHEGTIVEQGKHADLVRRGGKYSELYKKQIEATSTGVSAPSADEPSSETPSQPAAGTPSPPTIPEAAKAQLAELRHLCSELGK